MKAHLHLPRRDDAASPKMEIQSMNRKKQSPPGATGGQGIVQLGGTNNSENTALACNLQHLRVAFLLRRHRLSPSFAAAVAPFLFREART